MGKSFSEQVGLARRGAPPEFLYRLLGKQVTIVQTNDDILTGVILGYSKYEILFKQDAHEKECPDDEGVEELTLLLFKHAITAIIPDEDGVFDRKPEEKKEPSGILIEASDGTTINVKFESEDDKKPAIDVMK